PARPESTSTSNARPAPALSTTTTTTASASVRPHSGPPFVPGPSRRKSKAMSPPPASSSPPPPSRDPRAASSPRQSRRRRRPALPRAAVVAAASAVALLLPTPPGVLGFAPPPGSVLRPAPAAGPVAGRPLPLPRGRSGPSPPRAPPPGLRGSNDDGNDRGGPGEEEARRLRESADRYRAEAERLRLTLGLRKVEELEGEVREFVAGSGEGEGTSSKKREEDKVRALRDRVEGLVRGSLGKEEADEVLGGLSSFAAAAGSDATKGKAEESQLPPLTDEEVTRALDLWAELPPPVRETLARAAGYSSVSDARPEELVRRLYGKNSDIATEELRRLYYQSFSDHLPEMSKEEQYKELYEVTQILADAIEEEMGNGTKAMELFPRVLQDCDEALVPAAEDADVVFQLLEKSFMAVERPAKVNGGYIIRGENRRKSADELLDELDGKLKKQRPEWTEKYQVNLVEIPSDASDELFEDVILITPNKFPLQAPRLLAATTTAVALFSSFVFCIDAFGENPTVMEKLKEATELAQNGGVYDIAWFNDLLIPLLATLGAAQGLHELGHYATAWSKQVKLSAPTILPSQALPYLSFQNRLKTSPKSYVDLFDIAFVGPVAGLGVSFVALLYGLQLTTTIDPETARFLPSLPVGYLAQSTLGGTIVDLVLGGGDGILLNQDAATQVPLHPVAIAGFLGLIVQALDLVPFGSTDGGRMSQAVLGRVWHLTFSGVVFVVLLVSSFTSDNSILLGYLGIYSFTQRDMEIPCRNEVDKVGLPRAVAALVSWLLAALILVPLR
ncbi:hypothetical protein ACHAWF_012248, partial [Thalassiosira exigua]